MRGLNPRGLECSGRARTTPTARGLDSDTEMNLVISREGNTLAWASTWVVDAIDGHDLIAVPRLSLSQELTLDLSATSYGRSFADSTVELRGEPRGFFVLRSDFALYTTGDAAIHNFACILHVEGLPVPQLGDILRRAAIMLR